MNNLYQVLIVSSVLLMSFGCEDLDKSTDNTEESVNKLTYHYDRQRSGWNPREVQLTPESVSGSSFGQLWQTPQFDSVDGEIPLLYATPLYVDRLTLSRGPHKGKTFSVIFAATDVGYVYAINAKAVGDIAPGTILWSSRISESRSAFGNISTPIIDLERQRIYMIGSNKGGPHRVYALDLGSGKQLENWPVTLDSAAVNLPGMNPNGTTQYAVSNILHRQRGALNLNSDGSRLYIAFGGDHASGWIISVDTHSASVASAFSATARTEETQGGMWASGGPSIDSNDRIHIATGASVYVPARKLGMPGIFPDSEHNWGQSVVQLRDDPEMGFQLIGTYSPFNWAQAQVEDIDLGSSGTVVIDLDPATTSTPHLLVAGGKQGNIYLLDRDNMPGSLVKRPAISVDSETDGSLLAPDIQPQFGKRGPLNVFGPYADRDAMYNQARSRTTSAYFKSKNDKNFLFVTGSAKTGDNFDISIPPGLARLEIVASPGEPAYLKIDQLEMTQTFQNPGSPIVTSNDGGDAIVWVMDTNVIKTSPMRGPDASRPVLYAFDALTFELLWKSAPNELGRGGKYNEVTISGGFVYIGTDRIQAFGLLPKGASRTTFPSPIGTDLKFAEFESNPEQVEAGQAIFGQRCVTCHDSDQSESGAPTLNIIGKLEPRRIYDALNGGSMTPMAQGLSQEDLMSVVAYLNSLSL